MKAIEEFPVHRIGGVATVAVILRGGGRTYLDVDALRLLADELKDATPNTRSLRLVSLIS